MDSIPSDTVDTILHETDSFGDLISTPVATTVAGVGVLSSAHIPAVSLPGGVLATTFAGAASVGSYNNDYLTAATPSGKVTELDDITSQNPQLGASTVTFTWTAPKNTWLVNTTLQVTGINTLTTPVTDSYTVNWYLRGATGLSVSVKVSPSATVAAGTPVNVAATVVDDHNRPVKGLFVQIFRSGPQGEASQTDPITCPIASTVCNVLFTDQNGSAGYTFLSTKPGGVTITTVVADKNGNEVFRHVDNVTYTGIGAPHLVESSGGGTVHLTLTTDSAEVGKTVTFYRMSGITGKVVPEGTGIVNASGIATRTNTYRVGQIVAVYAKVQDATLPLPYSNTVAFKVK